MPLFLMLLPQMPEWYFLFIAFFGIGVSNGIMDVAMNAQAVEVEKVWQRSIMTFFHAMFSVGMIIGALVGGICVSRDVDVSTHFTAVGVLTLVVMGLSARFLLSDHQENTSEEEIFFAWPKGAIIGLGVIAFCCMMGEGAMADWSAIYMEKIVEVKKSLQVAGLIAFTGLMAAGRFVGDYGRNTFGDKWMMTTGAIISLAGIGLILSLAHPYVVILGFGLVGLGLSNIVPIVYSLAGNYPGIPPGMGIAMATTIGYTGFMAGPPLIGFVADSSNLRMALGLLAVLFIIMAFLVITFRSKDTV